MSIIEMSSFLVTETIKCRNNDLLEEAALLFKNGKVDTLPIVDDKDIVVGVITQKSLAHAILSGGRLQTPVVNFQEDAVKIKVDELYKIFDYSLERIVIVDNEDKLIGVISPTQLFTTILQLEQTIDELNVILNGSSSSIIAINREARVIVFNKAAEKVLRIPAWQAIGRPIRDISLRTPLPDLLESKEVQIGRTFEYRGQHFVTNRIPIMREGEVVGAVSIFQDVTELREVTEELCQIKEYQKNIDNIMNNPYDTFVAVDTNGIITVFNKNLSEFLGIPMEEAVGRHVTEVIENTRLHEVAKTGRAEIGAIQKIQGSEIVVMRLPMEKEGRLIGALGKIMFKDIKEMTGLANKINKLSSDVEYYKDVVKKYQKTDFTSENIVGDSKVMQEIKHLANRVAQSNSTVLIRGESGTGKELFASAIHYESNRRQGPFIKINCAAIPENLLESELFGYEEGAFTGAKRGGKTGKFELANKGTIFLDEIGDMPISMQVKLLRVLQEREIERIGAKKPMPVDVRVITATNRMLEDLIEKKLFRADLYYRLNVVELKIPPLRHRRDDIPDLVEFLLKKLSNSMACCISGITGEAMDYLCQYHWPGNIRELENVLEHCLNFVDGKQIELVHLPSQIRQPRDKPEEVSLSLKNLLEETERKAIKKALKEANGNKNKAAESLGICRANIYQKIEKYGIE